MREDDQDETDLAGFAPIIPRQLLRKQLGMTQDEFARALRIRCRRCAIGSKAACSRIRPRVRSPIVAKNPKAALRALAT